MRQTSSPPTRYSSRNPDTCLVDLLRPRVGSGIKGAVGRVFGGAAGGFDDVVHFFQRRDVRRFEACDVGAVPLVGVGARVGGIHVRRFL